MPGLHIAHEEPAARKPVFAGNPSDTVVEELQALVVKAVGAEARIHSPAFMAFANIKGYIPKILD
ncbi:hypothetical protein [Sporomusa ovata]|uniref:hypothetical protein n=1 Tax=Sporomusa ovata TaxID=2378 RepID=UPI0012681ACF|nr:hypothetical protein [Sporomusa ovata]